MFTLVMALLPHPPRLPGEPSDKIQHIIAFTTLGLLGGLAFPGRSIARLLTLLSLFGAFIEIAQAIPALNRDSDVVDWIADTFAAAAALAAVRRLWRLDGRRSGPYLAPKPLRDRHDPVQRS